jgi:hypothetical protein
MPGKGDYMNEIHMTLRPGARLVITVGDAEEADVSATPGLKVTATRGPDDPIATAITRLARTGKPQVREVADRLIALGYRLHRATTRTPGPPENYLRFEDPARGKPAVGYLFPNATGFRYLGLSARFLALVTVGSSWLRACREPACRAG